METATVTSAMRSVNAAIENLEKAIAAFESEGEKVRDAAEAAAQAYLSDVNRKKAAVADQIQALDEKAAALIQQKRTITQGLAKRAVTAGQKAVDDAQKQLASIVAECATIDEMKAALKAGKVPGDDSLYAAAVAADKELHTVNDMRSELYSRMGGTLKDATRALERIDEKRFYRSHYQNKSIEKVQQHHDAPDVEPQPEPIQNGPTVRNLEVGRYYVGGEPGQPRRSSFCPQYADETAEPEAPAGVPVRDLRTGEFTRGPA